MEAPSSPNNNETDKETPDEGQISQNSEREISISVVAMPPTGEKHHHGDKKGKRREKPPDVVTYKTHLTTLAHISVLVFVYMIFKLAFRGEFDFFTWHPLLMSVGWMFMMTEGFYVINKHNTYWRFKTKGMFREKLHVIIISIGYILTIIGFIIVYINKENKGKNHFVSWHGLFGLIGLVATLPPVINGIPLWYKRELKEYINYPRLVKFVHVSSGTIAFAFGAVSLVLSVYTKWWGRRSNHSDATFYFGLLAAAYPMFWAVYGPSVKLARTVRDYFNPEKDE